MEPHVHRRTTPLTRRDFVQTTITTAGLLAVLPRATIAAADQPAKLRAAVIGHTGRGNYGHGLDLIFRNRPGVELVGLADPDDQGRAKTAAKIGAPRTYRDYRQLITKERPQLVSLAMRQADQHHPIALHALRAGAHLYCEKPFTTTPAEADELLSEAANRDLRIAVAHVQRVSSNIIGLKQAITDGVIGELAQVHAYGKQDSRAGGEDMMVLGTHLFDLMRLFLGNPISCTSRVLWKGQDITQADRRIVRDNVGPVAGDDIFAHFAFPDGINATFTSSARLRPTIGRWGIELLGSKGAVRLNCNSNPTVFVSRSTAWSPNGRNAKWEPLELPAGQSIDPVADWLDAINLKREPRCSGRNAAWAIEMVMAVYHSALSRRRVSFPLEDRSHPLGR